MIVDGNTYCSVITPILPPEYQEVEYLESHGTEYIDTGIKENYRFVLDIQFKTSNSRCLVGYSTFAGNYFEKDANDLFALGSSVVSTTNATNRQIIEYSFNNNTATLKLPNETIERTNVYFYGDSNFKLFWVNDVNYAGNGNILYSAKVYDNSNNLIRNFIPCYRKSDNVIGMYDTVNKVFYTNQGTGTFLKGNNVVHTIKYNVPCEETIYHIRGTATDNFDFTLKYIDRNNNITTITEHAVIDENGNWDISYSGKKIKELNATYKNNTNLKTIEFTESMSECTSLKEAFSGCSFDGFSMPNATFGKVTDISGFVFNAKKIKKVNFSKADFSKVTIAGGGSIGAFFTGANSQLNQIIFRENETFESLTNVLGMFGQIVGLTTLDIHSATFENVENTHYLFWRCYNLQTLHIDNAEFVKAIKTTDRNPFDYNSGGDMFQECSSLQNLYVPQSSTLNANLNLKWSPLSYESMLRVAGWLKDLTNQTAKTIVFKADTYNNLTAEQKATLQNIIVTQKGWNLATA